MRILSKFHDYYDTAMALGLDPTRLYDRTPQYHKFEVRFWPGSKLTLPISLVTHWRRPPSARSITVGFCGKHYPVWVEPEWEITIENLTSHDKQRHWLPSDEVLERERRRVAELYRQHRYLAKSYEDDGRVIRRHEQRVREAPEDLAPFRLLRCPVYAAIGSDGFVYGVPRVIEVITNPRLATLGFERILDSFSTFQAIATFLDNELATSEDCPHTVGGDDVVARAKGFDENSFRTAAPGQKKLNRKANRERKQGGRSGHAPFAD